MSKIIKARVTLIIISLTLFMLFGTCKKSPTEPTEEQPGRRDYVWTVDTLNLFYPATKIWGSSPTDVWSINESDFEHSIWHYDGDRWSTDGVYRFVSPHALWGFSQNEVYIGGKDGKIWKYDGKSWSQIAALTKEGTEYVAYENIWGESPNDFYAIGSGPDSEHFFNVSVIAHYANNHWNMLNTDSLKGNVVHFYKNKPDNKTYLRLTKIGYNDTTIIYEYNQGIYTRLYSILWTKTWADITLIDNEVYFILKNEIAKRVNNQFQTVLKIDNPNFYQRIWGRNSKDIFILMTDGLAHYNGSNIEYLFYFNKPRTQIPDAALFEKEVFFTVDEASTNLKFIYHGKLKESQ